MLREEKQLIHREKSRSPIHRHRPEEYIATDSNTVWSRDITYLKSTIRGVFFYLYLVEDVWSRQIVAAAVHDEESAEHPGAQDAQLAVAEHAAALLEEAYRSELERRRQVYEQTRARTPERWSRNIRNWDPIKEVKLNPKTTTFQRTG